MKIKVLDRASIGEDTPLHLLEKYGELSVFHKTEPHEISERISDADIIIINKIKITKELISQNKSLKLICVFATGYDNIDLNAAREAGIAVCNVPAYSTDSVCLFTFATALALITKLIKYSDFVKSGEYSHSEFPNRITPVYHELSGKTWGIIGCGNIGKAVADIAKAFGANVIVYTRTPKPGYQNVTLETLCTMSDIISIHTPLTAETKGIINKTTIGLMKRDVVIINEARGSVVNEKDIANAVRSCRIGAFGCDVYSEEPFGESHPYFEIKNHDNVILTPHAAWGSYEARVRCVETILKNIESYLSGGDLNRVDLR